MIILAIGQPPELSFVPKGIKITENSTIQVALITQETNLPGIFAGGDAVSRALTVVEAIAAGKKASVSIDCYLKGEDLKSGRYIKPNRFKKPPNEGVEKMARQHMPVLPVNKRTGNFKEVKMGFNLDTEYPEHSAA
jgi:pyruvate/2-oxoglutarate dehydrogenase complex dihydrolipoamide dehydrogenase (E3) component